MNLNFLYVLVCVFCNTNCVFVWNSLYGTGEVLICRFLVNLSFKRTWCAFCLLNTNCVFV